MTDLLILTEAERAAILNVVKSFEINNSLWDRTYLVQRIEDAVNVVRRGDPVGTVRCVDAGTPYYAIKMHPNYDTSYPWIGVNLYPKALIDTQTPDRFTEDDVADWKIIYTPPLQHSVVPIPGDQRPIQDQVQGLMAAQAGVDVADLRATTGYEGES